MEILNSDWLINMLKKSSKMPQGRLLSLFEILADWLTAPNIAEKIREDSREIHAPQIIPSALEHYLTQQAALAGAEEPAMLAHQLYFMLLAAIQEAIRAQHTKSFMHAKSVAQALITAQTKQPFHFKRSLANVAAASLLGAFIIFGGLWMFNGLKFNLTTNSQLAINPNNNSTNKTLALNGLAIAPLAIPQTVSQAIASPEDTAALFATLEQMRKGNCQFPEALQLPDSYKAVYIDNIIGGNISTKVSDQKIIVKILQKVRCNYTPMLMENSTS